MKPLACVMSRHMLHEHWHTHLTCEHTWTWCALTNSASFGRTCVGWHTWGVPLIFSNPFTEWTCLSSKNNDFEIIAAPQGPQATDVDSTHLSRKQSFTLCSSFMLNQQHESPTTTQGGCCRLDAKPENQNPAPGWGPCDLEVFSSI